MQVAIKSFSSNMYFLMNSNFQTILSITFLCPVLKQSLLELYVFSNFLFSGSFANREPVFLDYFYFNFSINLFSLWFINFQIWNMKII